MLEHSHALYAEVGHAWRRVDDLRAPAQGYAFSAQLGGGLLFNLTEHLFVDGNLEWEGTTSIDVGPDDTRLDGLIGRIGIGFSF